MKKLIVVLILAIFAGIGYMLFMPKKPAQDKTISNLQQEKLNPVENNTAQNDRSDNDKVALHFKDGSVMIGEMIRKTKDEYHIKWKGEETIVYAELVDYVTSATEELKGEVGLSDEEISLYWPYKNDIVIRLKNRAIVDAKIDRANRENLHLIDTLEGGGSIEQDIARSDIEYLIFKPIDNEEAGKIERSFRELFPKMNFYKDGNFTIVTDSYITWVKEYTKVLRAVYTNIYLDFFDLFKDKKAQSQNFVVIFDDYVNFVEYAVADGVPGWAVAGYFNPDDKALYLFNVLGERFSEILFQGIVGESGKSIDHVVETVEKQVDKRYHIFIEGQVKAIRDEFWDAYSYYRDMFRELTLTTLRHEFAHEVFNNWGLQNISVSRFEGMEDELVKRKKEFLETKDCKKKAQQLKALLMQRGEDAPLDMKAANSWLSEGIATYCETEEIGTQNNEWLFIYQEMARKGPIYPLEFLTVYKIGSFPGVYSKAMLDLYAQSWAFVSFLMERYPREFIDYQNKLAGKDAKESEDIKWLLQALGKDSRTIENEFAEYMNKFKELEDPFLVHFDRLYSIYN